MAIKFSAFRFACSGCVSGFIALFNVPFYLQHNNTGSLLAIIFFVCIVIFSFVMCWRQDIDNI